MNKKSIRKSGFSLVEALVGVALIGLAGLAVTTSMASLSKSRRVAKQKNEILNYRNYLQNEFTSSVACTEHFKTSPPISLAGVTIDNPSSTVLSLPELRISFGPNSKIAATVGQPVMNSTTGATVKSISFGNITATGTAGEYQGFFEIQFNGDSALKPVRIAKIIKVDEATGQINQCKGRVVQEEVCKVLGQTYDDVTKKCIGGGPVKAPPGKYYVTHSGAQDPWSLAPNTCQGVGLAPYNPPHPLNEYQLVTNDCYMFVLGTTTCNGTMCLWRHAGPSGP